MKIKFIVLFVLVITGFFACKSKKESHVNKHVTESVASNEMAVEIVSQKDSFSNIMVSFISIGSGTDGKARVNFLALLDTFQKDKNIALEIEVRRWGREGEVDYCINTTTLSKNDLLELKNSTSKLLGENKLVRMNYGSKCVLK
jgi:hypothetical protein